MESYINESSTLEKKTKFSVSHTNLNHPYIGNLLAMTEYSLLVTLEFDQIGRNSLALPRRFSGLFHDHGQ